MDDAQEGPVNAEEISREPISKVKRTYGRKKELCDASDDASFRTVTSYRTRLESADGDGELRDTQLPRFLMGDASNAFGWKEKLALIDKRFDEREAQAANELLDKEVDDHINKDCSSAKSVSTEDDSVGLHDETLLSGSMHLPSSQSDPPSTGSIEAKSAKTEAIDAEPGRFGSAGLTQARYLGCVSPTGHSNNLIEVQTATAQSSLDEEREVQNVSTAVRYDDGSNDKPNEALREPRPWKNATKKPERTNKIKKLSKKEEKKAHARIMAEQRVSISKRAEQYTVEHLLKSVRQKQLTSEAKPYGVSSDPIQEFSSSPMMNSRDVSSEREPLARLSNLRDISDDDMPDMHVLLKVDTEKKLKEEEYSQRKEGLAVVKRRVIESLEARLSPADSDDDDLEVVANGSDGTSKHPGVSTAYEKKLAGVAGFRVGVGRHSLSGLLDGSQGNKTLILAAKSTFGDRDSQLPKATVGHRDLQAAMLNKATKQSMQITRGKEEEWKRRGGKLTGKFRSALSNELLSLDHLAKELTLRKRDGEENGHAGTRSSSEGGSDEDWQPNEHGFASPSSQQSAAGSGQEEEELEGSDREHSDEDTQSEKVPAAQGQQIDTEEDEEPGQPPRQSRRPTGMLVLSDSEGEDAHVTDTTGRILVPDTSVIVDDRGRGSIISLETGPDEWDKENDTPLPTDSGDDKENAMVISQTMIGRTHDLENRQPCVVFGPEERAQRLSMSPIADSENGASRGNRIPLQARKIGKFDDPFLPRSQSSGTTFGTPKSNRVLSTATSPVFLRPAFDGSARGFTQLFSDEEGAAPAGTDVPSTVILQPAFRLQMGNDTEDSPFKPSPEPKPVKLGALSDAFGSDIEEPDFMGRSKRPVNDDELSLTFDTGLQPALDVTTQIRRKADAVFEKEQDFVIEEASTSTTPSRSKQDLFVSENGLLTQTRPEGSTPLVFRSWTQSQTSNLAGSRAAAPPPLTTQRLPLSTLSLAAGAVSRSQQQLTRLVKGKAKAALSDEGDVLASSPHADRPPSAFTKLLTGAKRQRKMEKKNFAKSHFVEGEAQESDEDEMFGFGVPTMKDDDGESEDDDPDAVVENLVDDAAMDAEQLAVDRVLEKVKEQLQEDDAALQKYHQAAIEGKYRGKRRGGGIAMDDSESDEDEDKEARRLRQRMHKKRRIQGDKLEDLGRDEKSRAFYEAYQRDIQEDDGEDFTHLASDDMDTENVNEEEETETVSTSEIQAQLREAARQQKGKERELDPFDPEDVEWTLSCGASDDELDIKEVDDRPRKAAPSRPVFGQVAVPDVDDLLPRRPNKISDEQAAQLAAWRKEQSGRNLGTGGMRGAVTVTGHGSKTTSRKGAPVSKTATGRPQDGEQVRRKMTKSVSILASVSDRQSRFGL